MTGAWFLVSSLGLMLLLTGLLLKNATLLAMALLYLVFSLLPFWRGLPKTQWKVHRSIEPDHIWADQSCHMTVSLMNNGEDLPEVHLTDMLADGIHVEGVPTYHGNFEAGKVHVVRYEIRGVRGKYEFPGVEITINDLLEMNRKEEFLPSLGTLFVLPAIEKVEKIKISPRRTRVYSGMIRSRESGAGVEFFGTRAYVPGDPLRHLNWKAGARWDLLITNLFEQERVADVGIVLDARSVVEIRANGESLFEHSVRAATALAEYFLGEGNRVGLLIYGRMVEWTFPGYGKQQRAKILAALSKSELGDHVVFKEFKNLPIRVFPPQSQIVLVSPVLPEDLYPLRYLRAVGYRVLIISPDPIAFEKRFLSQDEHTVLAEQIARMERNTTLSKLRRARVNVMEWDVALPLWISIRQSLVERRR